MWEQQRNEQAPCWRRRETAHCSAASPVVEAPVAWACQRVAAVRRAARPGACVASAATSRLAMNALPPRRTRPASKIATTLPACAGTTSFSHNGHFLFSKTGSVTSMHAYVTVRQPSPILGAYTALYVLHSSWYNLQVRSACINGYIVCAARDKQNEASKHSSTSQAREAHLAGADTLIGGALLGAEGGVQADVGVAQHGQNFQRHGRQRARLRRLCWVRRSRQQPSQQLAQRRRAPRVQQRSLCATYMLIPLLRGCK